VAAAFLLEGLQALTPDRSANLVAALCGAGGVLAAALVAELRSATRPLAIISKNRKRSDRKRRIYPMHGKAQLLRCPDKRDGQSLHHRRGYCWFIACMAAARSGHASDRSGEWAQR
jgi:hypothetical protein